MAIKVGGVIAIDNSQNLSFGISTVGSGNSTITSNSTKTLVGVAVTLDNINGNISIGGSLTAAGLSFPLGI